MVALLASLALLVNPIAAAAAPLSASAACLAAIALAETDSHLPPRLLAAIAVVESGRADPDTGAATPWPWTIDIGGVGRTFDTQTAAIAAVQDAQQSGIQSIDVGCMQVNLMYHPHAFATLEEAFDPVANVRYAARFLEALHAETGEWAPAIAAYHSVTPEFGSAYAQRVAATWPLAARFGLAEWAAGRALTATLDAEVDPQHVLTPEFRARMIDAAAFRHRQQAAGLLPDPPGRIAVRRPKEGAHPVTLAALEAEVDPKHVLTPEFRAQMVAAAAFRHQRQAGPGATPPAVEAPSETVAGRRFALVTAP